MTVAASGDVVPCRTSLNVEPVIVDGRMASEKVASTLADGGTPVAPLAGLSATTRGATVSTIQVRRAGVGSRSPAALLAATSKECEP
ncbi:MAG TPA: hypothetical protein VK387_05105 [Thermoleophilaceae bacterium]|nr:hypothetical protein [Thermoleophilaceae bacterium]